MNRLLATLIVTLYSAAAFALTIDTPLADSAQEARARALFYEIRCAVCQGEAIADSPAEVARDMRAVVRGEIASGKSDAEIKSYLTSRYGDFILMRPPLKPATALLWFGPVIIFMVALALAVKYFRRPRASGKNEGTP